MESAKALYKKIKTEKRFRQIFIVFICCCWTFLVVGWNLGQGGPTLLDLQILSRCSLEEASLFLTLVATGYMVSTFVVGITFDRFDKYLHIVFGNIGMSAAMAAIPWSVYLELMFTMHVLKGFSCGVVDAVVSTLIIYLLGKDCRAYMQVLYLFFRCGGILSPLASAPFLTPIEDTSTDEFVSNSEVPKNFTSGHFHNVTIGTRQDLFSNISTIPTTYFTLLMSENITVFPILNQLTNSSEFVTDVYKAYTISSGLSFVSGIPFLIIYFKFDKDLRASATNNTSNDINKSNTLPLKFQLPACIILFMISGTYTAIEESFGSLLATFAVRQFNWTKYTASYVTSLFYGCIFTGSVLGIFIAPLFRLSRFLCCYSFMIILSFLCLFLTTLHGTDLGIWITAVMSGIFMSVNIPLLYAWVEEDFMHVTARVTALLLVSSSLGVILNPIFLGKMMQESPVWFVYILLGESIILFFLFLIGLFLSRYTRIYHKNSKSEFKENLTFI